MKHSLSIYFLGAETEVCTSVCYPRTQPAPLHLLHIHKMDTEYPESPLLDCLLPSDDQSLPREKESGTLLKVSFHQEARSRSPQASFQKAKHSPDQRRWEE